MSVSDMPIPSSLMIISDSFSVIFSSGMVISTLVAFASQAFAMNSPITGGSVEYICIPKCLIVETSNSIRNASRPDDGFCCMRFAMGDQFASCKTRIADFPSSSASRTGTAFPICRDFSRKESPKNSYSSENV